MSRFIDLTGERFGRLIVIKRVQNDKQGGAQFVCKCICGKEKIVGGSDLRDGNTKSCGCLYNEGNNYKHGHKKKNQPSKTYQSWQSMIRRCTDSNDIKYSIYGGRGITVCNRWRKFENFLEDMGEVPKDRQIDRIDNNKGYCKSNCRWATRKEQARNKRNNRLITHDGKTQCIAEWAEEFDINYQILWDRLCRYNWPIEKALTTPTGKQGKKKEKVK
ncbi:hypothetical protein LCGC14_2780380 [marine sediment metagenome]|uniref:Uncharacterized protein n=1 Tax=marine sediment metagenome TaxID=412755 RepID=A0A0F9BJZ7_9ZZZZ